MLSRDRLRDKLREFCDPQYASFRGFPPSKPAARAEWAGAFDDYLSVVEEDIPRPPPPPDTHPSLVTTGVKAAFQGNLALTDALSAAVSAADFADAWKAAIEAITPGPPATDPSSTTYVFIKFTNLAAKHAALRTTLKTLFEAPTIATVARLTDIASAFHAATDGLEYSATKTVPGTPPVTTTATIGLK